MAKVTDIGVDMSMERCDKVCHLFTKWYSSIGLCRFLFPLMENDLGCIDFWNCIGSSDFTGRILIV